MSKRLGVSKTQHLGVVSMTACIVQDIDIPQTRCWHVACIDKTNHMQGELDAER